MNCVFLYYKFYYLCHTYLPTNHQRAATVTTTTAPPTLQLHQPPVPLRKHHTWRISRHRYTTTKPPPPRNRHNHNLMSRVHCNNQMEHCFPPSDLGVSRIEAKRKHQMAHARLQCGLVAMPKCIDVDNFGSVTKPEMQ